MPAPGHSSDTASRPPAHRLAVGGTRESWCRNGDIQAQRLQDILGGQASSTEGLVDLGREARPAREDLARRTVRRDPAILQHDHPVGAGGNQIDIVCRQQRRQLGLPAVVHAASRLMQEEHRWIAGQHRRQRRPLALAVAQVERIALRQELQPQLAQGPIHVTVMASAVEHEAKVVCDRRVEEHRRRMLGQVAHRPGEICGGHVAGISPEEAHAAALRAQQAIDLAEQRRFSSAISAPECGHQTSANRHRDTVEHDLPPVRKADILQLHQLRSGSGRITGRLRAAFSAER